MIRHTLVLLVTTSGAQAAGVVYAQPGERRVAHVAALSAAALANVSLSNSTLLTLYFLLILMVISFSRHFPDLRTGGRINEKVSYISS